MGVETRSTVSPTDRYPDLTEAGRKLLEVLSVPELRIQSITQICQQAGISRDSYYRLFSKDENFIKAYTELCRNTLLSFALPASQALGRQATLGDPQSIKMILEMSGLYQQQATLNVNHTVEASKSLLELYRSRKQNELEGSAE